MFQTIYQKLQTREGITLVASIALIVLVISFIFGGFRCGMRDRMMGDEGDRTITVSGSGEAFAIPDVARFTFTISKDAKTMADAQSQVSTQGNALVEKLKAAGILEKDIKTEGFNAYPKYETKSSMMRPCTPEFCPPYDGNPMITGYTVSHTYSVKVRAIDNASAIAKIITDANVSSLSGPDFTVDDMTVITNDARDRAITDAKTQAKILAKQLGVRLDDIVDFQVVNNGNYPIMYAKASMDSGAESASAPAPAFEAGQTDIKVEVMITYEIK